MAQQENQLFKKFLDLKNSSGSHSPSVMTLREKMPELDIKVDACFLSNPYATELFLKYLNDDLNSKLSLRDLLEFYPSTNEIISDQLSKAIDVDKRNIFVCNGAIEAIQTVIHNFTKDKIIVNIPTFSSYYEFVKPDIEVVYYRLKKYENFKLNIDEYIKFVKKNKPNTVVLINPNNPDGSYIEFETLDYILNELTDIENIIIDESFIHFAYEDKSLSPVSVTKLLYKYNNLIVIKSMSKDFGIAGIRAGYAIMSESKIKNLLKNGFLWNSNGFSEYFFRLYGNNTFLNDYEIVRKKYIKETSAFFKKLDTINRIKIYPSKANFVLIELINEKSSDNIVSDLLINHGVYVRTCSDKIGLDGNFIRLASRTFDHNEIIYDSLLSIF